MHASPHRRPGQEDAAPRRVRLTTERLLIRGVRAADTETLVEIRRRVAAFQGRSSRTLEETRAMFAEMEARQPGGEQGWYQYVIEARSGGVIGDVGVHFGGPGERQAEIGYSLHPDHWGRGYASEALRALIGHLFGDHRLHRVTAMTGADNRRSRALLERLGFRHEGSYREAYFDAALGRWVDDAGYAVLASEWSKRGTEA